LQDAAAEVARVLAFWRRRIGHPHAFRQPENVLKGMIAKS
jgi:hypothetical protein